MGTTARYREVAADSTTGRLLTAGVITGLGDFVGAGALLVLAFERSGGRALGAAGFLAATGLGSLGVAVFGAPLLDRIPRRTGLVWGELVGAAGLVLPLAVPALWPIYLAAFIVGAQRAATTSFRHGVLADAVATRLRGGLLGLLGATDQLGQVLGYLAGSALAVGMGAELALWADVTTFGLAALVLVRLRVPPRTASDAPPTMLSGWATVASHPHLRLLVVLVVATTAASALPETLASAAVGTASPWLPFVLASGAAGGTVGYLVAGRLAVLSRFGGQLVHLTLYAVAVVAGALVQGPVALLVANVAIGAGAAWLIGVQVALVRLTPPDRMAQVMATMVAVLVLAEGAWVMIGGAIADSVSVRAAYGVAAGVVVAGTIIGWTVHLVRGTERGAWDPAVAARRARPQP